MTEPAQIPKALEQHTRVFYDKLVSLGTPDFELGGLVVETRLTHLQRELEIPGTYYARIRAILFDGHDPCIIMLRRGTGGKPSVIVLRHPPDAETFTNEGLTNRPHAATLYLRMAERIDRIEAWRDSTTGHGTLNIVEALRNHETRLAKLEASAAASKGETNGKTAQDPTT